MLDEEVILRAHSKVSVTLDLGLEKGTHAPDLVGVPESGQERPACLARGRDAGSLLLVPS